MDKNKEDNSLWNELHETLLNNKKGVGLDFGTFRSMMATKDANQSLPQIIKYENPYIREGIPSLFWYSNAYNKEFVCEDVLSHNGLFDDPKGVCSSVKTKLEDDDIVLNGKHFRTRYIAEQIIRRVIKDSHEAFQRDQLEEISYDKLVVGIPVRFGAAVRRKLLGVMRSATNHKKIILLPEPIAAAITYARTKAGLKRKILVFDLGAGTFDTVLLVRNSRKTKEEPFDYISNNPDGMTIAGDFFDLKMSEIIIRKLKSSPGMIDITKITNKRSSDYHHLLVSSRIMKEKLSKEHTHSELIEGTSVNGKKCLQLITVSRKEFENAIYPYVMEAVNCAYNVLIRSNEHNSRDIDIILVGGSTYIPLVRELIIKKFTLIGEENILQINPETAIALGCAIYANEELCDTPIAYAYAIGTHSNKLNKDILEVIIPSYVKRPFRKVMKYRTRRDNQESIEFSFFELDYGNEDEEIDPDEGKKTHISVKHSFMRMVPQGTPVEVIVELSKEGLLTVIIDDKGITNIDKRIIDTSNLGGGM